MVKMCVDVYVAKREMADNGMWEEGGMSCRDAMDVGMNAMMKGFKFHVEAQAETEAVRRFRRSSGGWSRASRHLLSIT